MSGITERIRRRHPPADSQVDSETNGVAVPTNGAQHMSGADLATEPGPDADAPPDAEPTRIAEPAPDAEPTRIAEPAPDAEPTRIAEPAPDAEPTPVLDGRPGFLERGRIRRRVRYLRRLRELQLRDLGGFLVELQRFGRDRPELVQAKLSGALRTDAELRALERSLGEEEPVREIREAGIGGACPNCGAVHGSVDRFCAACGTPLGSGGSPRR